MASSRGSAWEYQGITDRLIELYAKGRSGSEIMRDLNSRLPRGHAPLTRNAIIGKTHRLGLSTPEGAKARQNGGGINLKAQLGERPRGRAPGSLSIPPKPGKAAKTFSHGQGVGPDKTSPSAPREVAITGPVPGSLNLPMSDPGYCGCKWPTAGEGADSLFCCIPTDEAYCPEHRRCAYQPTTPPPPSSRSRDTTTAAAPKAADDGEPKPLDFERAA
jgi:hypothetical protein